MTKAKRESLKDWLQIIAFLIAGCWAAYTFYYDKIVEPENSPLSISLSGEAKKVSADKEFDLYNVKISIQNKSKVRETILATWFEVKGYNFKRMKYDSDKSYLDTIIKNGPTTRYDDIVKTDLLDWELITTHNSSLSPDQGHELNYLILVPQKKYEALRVNCYAVFSAKPQKFKIDRVLRNGNISFNLTDTSDKSNPIVFSINDVFKRKASLDKYKFLYTRTISDFSIGLSDTAITRLNKGIIGKAKNTTTSKK